MPKFYPSVATWKENVICLDATIYLLIYRDNLLMESKIVTSIGAEFDDFFVIMEVISKGVFGLVIAESISAYNNSAQTTKTYKYFKYSEYLADQIQRRDQNDMNKLPAILEGGHQSL